MSRRLVETCTVRPSRRIYRQAQAVSPNGQQQSGFTFSPPSVAGQPLVVNPLPSGC